MTAAAAAERLQPPRTEEIFIARGKSLGGARRGSSVEGPGDWRMTQVEPLVAQPEDHNLRHLNFLSKEGRAGVVPHAFRSSSKTRGGAAW